MQTERDNMTRYFTLLQRAGSGSSAEIKLNNGAARRCELLGQPARSSGELKMLNIYPSLTATAG